MTEATVQQPATTTREQIWLNREQVRKEKPVYRALKRAQDMFFSLLALIVLSPLMLIVAIAIVIDDPSGSPIFTQVRSGIDGKEFRIHKFRSMCVDAEAKLADLKRSTEMNGPIFKHKDDPRITRVGRFIRKCGIPQCLHDELFFKNETMGGQHESLQDCGCWRRLRRHGDGGAAVPASSGDSGGYCAGKNQHD